MGYIEEIRALVGHRPLILVGSTVIVTNETGQILLQQRRHPHGVWGLPGGLMELGESVEETARREVLEETGLHVGSLNLIGVFSGAQYFVKAGNGDEFYVVTTAFHTADFNGTIQVDSDESIGISFFDIASLPTPMVGSHQKMIKEYVNRNLPVD